MGKVEVVSMRDIDSWIRAKGYRIGGGAGASLFSNATFEIGDIIVVLFAMNGNTIEHDPAVRLTGYRLLLCDRGSLTIRAGGVDTRIDAGEAFLVEAETIASVSTTRSSQHWVFLIDGSSAFRLRTVMEGASSLRITSPYLKVLSRVTQTMLDQQTTATLGKDAYLAHVCMNMIVAAIRHHLATSGTPERAELDLGSKALAMIRVHAADPTFSVGTLAQMLDVELRQLQRALTPFEVTPSQLLRQARVSKVRELLAVDPTLHLTLEVANTVGFSSRRAMINALRAPYPTPKKAPESP